MQIINGNDKVCAIIFISIGGLILMYRTIKIISRLDRVKIVLSEDLAKRRVYPSVDLFETRGKRTSTATGIHEGITNDLIRSDYLSAFTREELYKIVMDVETFQDLETQNIKQLKNKKK